MLFFKITCFIWAAIAILSRVAMAIMKEKWSVWEENNVYKEKRPWWVIVVAILGLITIAAIWIVYIQLKIPYGWVLATLITLTAIKILTLLFHYDNFRIFLKTTLADKKKMAQINLAVILLAALLILAGTFLYM